MWGKYFIKRKKSVIIGGKEILGVDLINIKLETIKIITIITTVKSFSRCSPGKAKL